MVKLPLNAIVAGIAMIGASGVSPAMAAPRVEVGVMNCKIAGGAGFIVGSSKRIACTFQSGGHREYYSGTINKFGIDIGFTGSSVISWAVLAPTQGVREGGLAGHYGGATGEATLGVGLGANILIGGSSNTIALQPLSIQAQNGLNVALGIAALELRADRD